MKLWRFFIVTLLLFSLAHTIRDILQILNVESLLTVDTGSDKTWCDPHCDYVTFPFEISTIAFASAALRKEKMGKFAWTAIAIFCMWISVYLWSYIKF